MVSASNSIPQIMRIRTYFGMLCLSIAPLVHAQVDSGQTSVPDFVKEFSNLAEDQRAEFGLLRQKAQQFFVQERIFESLEKLHEADKIFSDDPAISNLRGACYVKLRKFEEAGESYLKALALEPENLGVIFNLAEMDFVTKKWEDSSEKFSEIASNITRRSDGPLEGQMLDLHRLAVFKKILSDYKLDRKDAAKKLAEEHWDDFDDTPFTYYSKAAFAYLQGDEDGGLEWIQSALRVFGGAEKVANWQDTMIEAGLLRSFYGGEEKDAAAAP